jgi:hypothetical protein
MPIAHGLGSPAYERSRRTTIPLGLHRLACRPRGRADQAGRGAFPLGRLRRPGELLWQVRDDDHPFVIGGQRLCVLSVAGHRGESGGE